MTIIFIVQNLFYQGKRMRDISLNAHYIVCFKNPRDRNQIYALAKQLYPISSKQVVQAYLEATQQPHSYLLFDLTQQCPEHIRIRTNIFPDQHTLVYVINPKHT